VLLQSQSQNHNSTSLEPTAGGIHVAKMQVAKRFQGKTAVVTGGANGIGLAICVRLAQEGARVFMADIDHAAAPAALDAVCSAAGADADVHFVPVGFSCLHFKMEPSESGSQNSAVYGTSVVNLSERLPAALARATAQQTDVGFQSSRLTPVRVASGSCSKGTREMVGHAAAFLQ